MKLQNELIENANRKLKDEIIDFKKRVIMVLGRNKSIPKLFYFTPIHFDKLSINLLV